MCFCTNKCKITRSELGRTREGLRKLISIPIVEGILSVKNKNVDGGIERIGGGGGDKDLYSLSIPKNLIRSVSLKLRKMNL